jgi:transcriptional regulator GlxA family with amidase domain
MYDFTILVLSNAFASSVALTLDILAAAASLSTKQGSGAPRWRVYSAVGTQVSLGNGVTLECKALPKVIRNDRSTWIVPGMGLTNANDLSERFTQPDAVMAIKALRKHAQQGGTIAASCSGVFLLQAAGLLGERKVTTTWWLAPLLQQKEPTCKVDANRMVIADGTIITAGAAMAQADLMLHLLSARFGRTLADAVSKSMIIDGRQAQAPFIVASAMANGDALIAKVTARLESALPNLPSITTLANEYCISERTLARHVRAATGKSTIDLLHTVRLNKARQLIANTRMSIEQVAEAVGYADSTALRRLMIKVFGSTPSQLRKSLYASAS